MAEIVHRREIGNDYIDGNYYNACCCGWESDSRSPLLTEVQKDDSEWRDHVEACTRRRSMTGVDYR
jgi:hypothetical protein